MDGERFNVIVCGGVKRPVFTEGALAYNIYLYWGPPMSTYKGPYLQKHIEPLHPAAADFAWVREIYWFLIRSHCSLWPL